jgi:hypothetical protein
VLSYLYLNAVYDVFLRFYDKTNIYSSTFQTSYNVVLNLLKNIKRDEMVGGRYADADPVLALACLGGIYNFTS